MILNHLNRPAVLFNPADKKHRNFYAEFLKNGTWGTCPVRFEVIGDMQNNNLAFAMQRKLVEYYMEKEFKVQSKFADPDLLATLKV